MRSLFTVASLLILAVFAGCLGYQAPKGAAPAPAAPSAPEAGAPDFTITSPAEGASITGDSVAISMQPINVAIKPAGGPVRADEGHFHIILDDGGYKPIAATSYTLSGLSPGQHTVTVELMNNDHSPRSPRVVKKVTFTVAGGSMQPSPTTTAPPAPSYRY